MRALLFLAQEGRDIHAGTDFGRCVEQRGAYYTYALLENGSLLNFGCNSGCLRGFNFGCPNGCRDSGPVLTELITELGAIRQVAPGAYHTCVLLENGNLRCFGCNNGYFSHLRFVGGWQCPVLRVEQPRPVLRADRAGCSQRSGGGFFSPLRFVGGWQRPVLRGERRRPVLRTDRSEHSRRHAKLGARLRQAFGSRQCGRCGRRFVFMCP